MEFDLFIFSAFAADCCSVIACFSHTGTVCHSTTEWNEQAMNELVVSVPMNEIEKMRVNDYTIYLYIN